MVRRVLTVRAPFRLIAFSLLALASAQAEAQAEASTEPSEHGKTPAVLWYRSSGDCPEGAEFLQLLGEGARNIRLAAAGDHVDFVVNLASEEGRAQGHLERQTARGTVAIREVEDPSCAQVAQVMALNLALALEGGPATEREDSTANDAENSAALAPTATQPEEGTVHRSIEEEATTSANEAQGDGVSPPPKDEGTQRAESKPSAPPPKTGVTKSLGLQAGTLSGLAPATMFRGIIFFEASELLGSILPHASARLAAVGAATLSPTTENDVRESVIAGHLDLCPVGILRGRVSVRPCLSGELGTLTARAEKSASVLFSALGVSGRAGLVLAGPWTMEAELGALFPLSRYEVVSDSKELYSSKSATISASIGTSITF